MCEQATQKLSKSYINGYLSATYINTRQIFRNTTLHVSVHGPLDH